MSPPSFQIVVPSIVSLHPLLRQKVLLKAVPALALKEPGVVHGTKCFIWLKKTQCHFLIFLMTL